MFYPITLISSHEALFVLSIDNDQVVVYQHYKRGLTNREYAELFLAHSCLKVNVCASSANNEGDFATFHSKYDQWLLYLHFQTGICLTLY
jgi:hypothetical protein